MKKKEETFRMKVIEPVKDITLEEMAENIKEIAIDKLKDDYITRKEYMILVENHNKSIKKITSALTLFAEQLNNSRKRIERLEK